MKQCDHYRKERGEVDVADKKPERLPDHELIRLLRTEHCGEDCRYSWQCYEGDNNCCRAILEAADRLEELTGFNKGESFQKNNK